MSNWIRCRPEFASHIRVNRGLYYHHGIYLNDDNVIQFGAPTSDSILYPSQAKVICTTLASFLRGGIMEVREFTEYEKSIKRSPVDIANYAMNAIGTGGYDLIKNNCEHFCNECIFGKKTSEQVDNILGHLFQNK